jgi:transposase
MSDQAMLKQKQKGVSNNSNDRTKSIIIWLNKIGKSKFSIAEFFQKHTVPFSRSQYYLYNNTFNKFGEAGLRDKRSEGGNKKLTPESEAFILGCVESDPNVSLKWIQEALNKRFDLTLSTSGVTRVLQRLKPDKEKRTRGRPKQHEEKVEHNSCGGFELIVALAYHLGWPQMTANAIKDIIKSLKRTKAFRSSENNSDKKGRDKQGRFTTKYNQRKDIRKNQFESISE